MPPLDWRGPRQVADPQDISPATAALRSLAQQIHADERVDMTLATVGDEVSFVLKRQLPGIRVGTLQPTGVLSRLI